MPDAGRKLKGFTACVVCAPNGHRRRPVGGYRYKDSEKLENLLLLGDESSPHAKVSMRVASRKGFRREAGSEVSGTAKVGMYEQEPHRRHGWVVKVAQHTKGRTYNSPLM